MELLPAHNIERTPQAFGAACLHSKALAFGVIGLVMIVFIWDRFRYDIVACCALILSVALGIGPFDKAFSGFSDDIVIIVGRALVVSAGMARSGIVDSAIKCFFSAP